MYTIIKYLGILTAMETNISATVLMLKRKLRSLKCFFEKTYPTLTAIITFPRTTSRVERILLNRYRDAGTDVSEESENSILKF